MEEVEIVLLYPNAQIPVRKHATDACYDLYACGEHIVPPHGRKTIGLGIAIAVPEGYAGIIRGRSGLTSSGIIVPTGTIDSGYRGEIGVTMFNTTDYEFKVETGARIAQFCLEKTYTIKFNEVKFLFDSDRGANGFGSTGLK